MLAIYQIRVIDYGVYIASSVNAEVDLNLQMFYLKNNEHHNLVLQRLYLHYSEQFYSALMMPLQDIRYKEMYTQLFRSKFPFTIDSAIRSREIDWRFLVKKYPRHSLLFIEVGPHLLAKVYDTKQKQIGLDVVP